MIIINKCPNKFFLRKVNEIFLLLEIIFSWTSKNLLFGENTSINTVYMKGP